MIWGNIVLVVVFVWFVFLIFVQTSILPFVFEEWEGAKALAHVFNKERALNVTIQEVFTGVLK